MHTLRIVLATALILSVRLCRAVTENDAGVHCGGVFSGQSIVCDTIDIIGSNIGDQSVIELMQVAIDNNDKPDSTTYSEGDRIFCFDNGLSVDIPNIGPVKINGLTNGGICAFPENLEENTSVSLGRIRELTDIIVRSSCDTCGRIAINYEDATDTDGPILKFDYTTNTKCFGDCITNKDLIREDDEPTTATETSASAAVTSEDEEIYTTVTVTSEDEEIVSSATVTTEDEETSYWVTATSEDEEILSSTIVTSEDDETSYWVTVTSEEDGEIFTTVTVTSEDEETSYTVIATGEIEDTSATEITTGIDVEPSASETAIDPYDNGVMGFGQGAINGAVTAFAILCISGIALVL